MCGLYRRSTTVSIAKISFQKSNGRSLFRPVFDFYQDYIDQNWHQNEKATSRMIFEKLCLQSIQAVLGKFLYVPLSKIKRSWDMIHGSTA